MALARLERAGKLLGVVTQNIDGLHQKAGSTRVAELHGSTLRNYCLKCHARYGVDIVLHSTGIPRCPKCGGPVRPDVVLYEEGLDTAVISQAVDWIRRADTLIVAGTSLQVYPAAGLIDYFHGDNLVLINKTPTPQDGQATLVLHEPVGEALGSLSIPEPA